MHLDIAPDHDVAWAGLEGGLAFRSARNPIRSRAARRRDHGKNKTAQPARPQLRADGDATDTDARRRAADFRSAARRAPRFREAGLRLPAQLSGHGPAVQLPVARRGSRSPRAQFRGSREGGPRLSPEALGAALPGRGARARRSRLPAALEPDGHGSSALGDPPDRGAARRTIRAVWQAPPFAGGRCFRRRSAEFLGEPEEQPHTTDLGAATCEEVPGRSSDERPHEGSCRPRS